MTENLHGLEIKNLKLFRKILSFTLLLILLAAVHLLCPQHFLFSVIHYDSVEKIEIIYSGINQLRPDDLRYFILDSTKKQKLKPKPKNNRLLLTDIDSLDFLLRHFKGVPYYIRPVKYYISERIEINDSIMFSFTGRLCFYKNDIYMMTEDFDDILKKLKMQHIESK